MEYTTNYNLILQGRKPERVSLDSLNGNFTKIDTLLKEQSENHNNHTSNTTPHVTAEEREKWDKNTTDIATVEEQAVLNRQTLGTECKNLLEVTVDTVTKSGITFTVNDDKSITVSGTATANADLEIAMDAPAIGDYILTGCPSGGGTDAYWIRAYYTVEGSTSYNIIDTDTGSGCNVKITATMARFIARIRIYSGQTVDNLVFKPMLRDARISDSTYVPYKESVEERLTEVETAITTARTEQTVWLGGGGNKAYTLPSTTRIIEVIFADSGLSAFTYRKLMRYGNNLAVISETKVGTTFDFTQAIADGVLTITASTSYGGTLAIIY